MNVIVQNGSIDTNNIDSVILSSQMLVCVTLRQGCIWQLWCTQQMQATNCPVWSFEYCCVRQVVCLWRFLATKLHRIDSWSILGNMLRSTNVVVCNRYMCISYDYAMCCLQLCCCTNKVAQCIPAFNLQCILWLCFPTKCFRALGTWFFFFHRAPSIQLNFNTYDMLVHV